MKFYCFPRRQVIAFSILFLMFSGIVFGSEQMLMIGDFSTSDAESGVPEGWEQLTFKKIDRHTRYELGFRFRPYSKDTDRSERI